MMDVSPHNQVEDRSLTDRMQIVNLYEMSWLVGTRRETRRGFLSGETQADEKVFEALIVFGVSC